LEEVMTKQYLASWPSFPFSGVDSLRGLGTHDRTSLEVYRNVVLSEHPYRPPQETVIRGDSHLPHLQIHMPSEKVLPDPPGYLSGGFSVRSKSLVTLQH
jgi:hypothetical protein